MKDEDQRPMDYPKSHLLTSEEYIETIKAIVEKKGEAKKEAKKGGIMLITN